MAANNSLTVSGLDFDSARDSLKAFLKNRSVFKDYDFEGANMALLLDLLAFNTELNGFYLNMINSEMNMDSAQTRDMIVSHAKELNYLPRSRTSSVATINLTIPTSNINTPGIYFIPKGTQFSGQNANGSFTFITDRTQTARSSNGLFVFSSLDIFEGSYFTETFIMDNNNETQRFILSNEGIDISSLTVQVSSNDGQTVDVYTPAKTLYGLDQASMVFFVQAFRNNLYEIVFGDNIFGNRPLDGSIIRVFYRASSGADGNGVNTFIIDNDLSFTNGGTVLPGLTVETSSSSTGGAERETIESIRFNAPRAYETLEHAITGPDYKNIIIDQFPDVKSVNVYGGEEITDSVEFGRVFISLSNQLGFPLTLARKNDIKTYLKERSVLGIEPVIVDPDYLYININTNVHVDFTATSNSPDYIKALVSIGIEKFNQNFLETFNGAFRTSKFVSFINDVDSSILSNETVIGVKRIAVPLLNTPSAISVVFNNSIQGGVTSSQFISGGKKYILTDTVKGVVNNDNSIYLLEINPSATALNYQKIGVVSYINGSLDINSINISSFFNSPGIVFSATPATQDIYSNKNDIIEIDTVNGVIINITSG